MDELSNPRYANTVGGILVDQPSGVPLYVDSGDLYQRIVAGVLGPVTSYIGDPVNEHPQAVSSAQIRMALLAAGMSAEQINALFAAAASVEVR